MLRVVRREVQYAPFHRDFAVADAQEAAEIDHRGLRLTLVADQDIHQAADVLALGIRHGVAEDGQRLVQRNLLDLLNLLLHLVGRRRRGGQHQCENR